MRTPALLAIGAMISVVMSARTVAQTVSPLQYQYPRTDARYVSRHASIILRPGGRVDRAALDNADLIIVSGSLSGPHAGRVLLLEEDHTILFTPDASFSPGERVTVKVAADIFPSASSGSPYSYGFTVDGTLETAVGHTPSGADLVRLELEQTPGLDLSVFRSDSSTIPDDLPSTFPELAITINDNPAPGALYLANMLFGDTTRRPWAMIVDNEGSPYYRARRPAPAWDFKPQSDGTVSFWDTRELRWLFFDTLFNNVRAVSARDGWTGDGHDIMVLPNGHLLYLTVIKRTVDMSQLVEGGDTAADVLDMGVQETDSAGNVVFQWNGADHFQIEDSYVKLTTHMVDYIHENAVDVDSDGNILISSRHLSEITKISRQTGDVIWRLGGKHNQFRFVGDTLGFSFQHAIRKLANGNYLLFDNGNLHVPAFSRAIEYRLDLDSMTAASVWAYRHPARIWSAAMGNAQRLPNGNTLISWGTAPRITEVRPDSSIALEMLLLNGPLTYRTFRFPPPSSLVKGMLLTPRDSAVDQPLDPQLAWERAAGAERYHLQIAMDPAFANLFIDDSTLATTYATVSRLAERTVYYWRERPIGSKIQGTWSDARTLMSEGGAMPQFLVSPSNGAREFPMSPAFVWKEYAPEARYRLQVSSDSGFLSTTVDTVLSGEVFWSAGLGAATRYFWRVQPEIYSWVGKWSDAWKFTTTSDFVSDPMPGIELTSPDADESFSRPGITFGWKTSGDLDPADFYRLRISGDELFRQIAIDTLTNADSIRIEGRDLQPGRYWWSVLSADAEGRQYRSDISTFEVAQWLGVRGTDAGSIKALSLHPNPTSSETWLTIALKERTTLIIRLTDVTGRRVAPVRTMDMSAGTHSIGISTEMLPEGVYTCSVTSSAGTVSRRFVVTR